MNSLATKTDQSPRDRKSCGRRHGRRIVKALLLTLAMGLAAWPVWNWVAAPVLSLPTITYWQMTGIVALIGFISMLFSGGGRHRPMQGPGHPAATCAWSHRGRPAETRQG